MNRRLPSAGTHGRSPPAVRAWVLIPLLLASTLTAAEIPRLELVDGQLVLTALPPILDDEEVRPHLTSGLTTTLAFRVELRDAHGRKIEGTARAEIRYELWDDVFTVVSWCPFGATATFQPPDPGAGSGDFGQLERRTLESRAALRDWWRHLRLVVASGLDPLDQGSGRVFADVVPFSEAEQDDTQRWFSESIDEARRSSAEDVSLSADERAETLSRTFNLLMATSIRRRAVLTYRWNVPIFEAAAP